MGRGAGGTATCFLTLGSFPGTPPSSPLSGGKASVTSQTGQAGLTFVKHKGGGLTHCHPWKGAKCLVLPCNPQPLRTTMRAKVAFALPQGVACDVSRRAR